MTTPEPEKPARYRRRLVEIDAIQWTGTNPDALAAFCGTDFATVAPEDRIDDPDQDAMLLVEASHWVGIKPTDWVLKFDGYFVAKDDGPFRFVWEPADVPGVVADIQAAAGQPETTAPMALGQDETGDDEDYAAYGEAQEKIHDLICGAADVSEWAINLGADGLQPVGASLNIQDSVGDDRVRLHFAFAPDMDKDTRTAVMEQVADVIRHYS